MTMAMRSPGFHSLQSPVTLLPFGFTTPHLAAINSSGFIVSQWILATNDQDFSRNLFYSSNSNQRAEHYLSAYYEHCLWVPLDPPNQNIFPFFFQCWDEPQPCPDGVSTQLLSHTLELKNLTLFLDLFILFYVHGYFACLGVCVPYACLMFMEVRRGHQIHRNWSIGDCESLTWELGTKPGSSERLLSSLNHRANSPTTSTCIIGGTRLPGHLYTY